VPSAAGSVNVVFAARLSAAFSATKFAPLFVPSGRLICAPVVANAVTANGVA
jgi:hypothetical protein